MAHQVKWTKQLTEQFIDMAMLSDDEAYIIRSRVKGTPVSVQAVCLSCSESTVHRMIATLKRKYDSVQAENPDIFPKRYYSQKERYMDNH